MPHHDARSVDDLAAAVGGATVLSARAYAGPPKAWANDLAADVKSAAVSEAVKTTLTPGTGDPASRGGADPGECALRNA